MANLRMLSTLQLRAWLPARRSSPPERGGADAQKTFVTGVVTAVATLALLATLSIAVYTSHRLATSTARVERAMLVKVAVANLAGALLEAEIGQRGYVLTGGAEYLASYDAAAPRALAQVDRLRELTADNATQRGLVVDVRRLVGSALDELKRGMVLRERGDRTAAAVLFEGEGALRSMETLQATLHEMETVEDALLAARRDREQRYGSLAIVSLLVTSILFGLLATVGGMWSRTAEARRRSAESDAARLRAENEVLAERQRTAQFQERFIAILGHDLRGPLSSIVMGLQILRAAPASAPAGIVDRLARSASRMTRMIDQLLDVARSRQGGGIPVRPAPANLGKIVRDVADEARAAHPDRSLVVKTSGHLEGVWDPDRVAQVVSNLVENALRHGAADVDVSVTVRGDADAVGLAVHNGGPPVPAGLAPVLFDAFRRGGADGKAAPSSGLGLGLYIAREIAVAHGGTIDFASNETDGTTFTLRLPRAASLAS
jgi:signal transduction histidine kinase